MIRHDGSGGVEHAIPGRQIQVPAKIRCRHFSAGRIVFCTHEKPRGQYFDVGQESDCIDGCLVNDSQVMQRIITTCRQTEQQLLPLALRFCGCTVEFR